AFRVSSLLFLVIPPPPRSTLFPYTTLFRSKIDANTLTETLRNSGHHGEHELLPSAISITQCSEAGTVYSLAELKAIKAIADKHDLALHMDGARFANALVSQNISPAQATWQAGVDL